MSSRDSSRYAKFLFSFPSLRVIIFINVFLEILISIFLSITCPILRLIPQALILVFLPIPYSLIIHKSFIRNDKILTFRRLLALQLIQEAIYTILIFIGYLTNILFHKEPCFTIFFSISLGTTLSSFISILAMLGFLRKNTVKVLAISLIYVFTQSFRWLVLGQMIFKTWIFMMLSIIISFFASVFFLFFLNHRLKGKIPIKPLSIFHAYLEYHLNKNPESFEKILEDMSEKRDLELSLLLLDTEKEVDLSIFGLSVHFGPFGTVGSSQLPSRLIKLIENPSLRVLLLRNLSNHSLNLPSWREVEKLRLKMVEALSSAKQLGECNASVVQKETEGYSVTIISICSYCIVLLSCPGYSVEDLPPEWVPNISSLISKYGFTPFIITDAHNSIDSSSWRTLDPDYGRFVNILEEVLKSLRKTSEKKVIIGFDRIHPSVLPNDEIGPGGISTIVLNLEGENHALIVIDGNNMVKGLRNYLVDHLKKSLNLSTLEIVTTDTHLLTGIRKAKKGYFPIGFKTDKELLLKTCIESIKNAISSLSACSIKVWIGKVEDIRVTGEVFNILESFVKQCSKMINILMVLTTLLTFLLSLILF
ncbi:MAG: DUF2070 family protein [Thermoproteota archaeon]